MAKRAKGDTKTGVARTVKDVPAQEFIAALAAHFKKSNKLELPEWHDFVKTSVAKEMNPLDADWYFVRAASLARKVYLRGGVGVGAFTRIYGGRQRRLTYGRFHFRRASKGIIRHILIQLGEQNLIDKKKDKKGRWITKEGKKVLDTIAGQVRLGQKNDSLPVIPSLVSPPLPHEIPAPTTTTTAPPPPTTKPTPGGAPVKGAAQQPAKPAEDVPSDAEIDDGDEEFEEVDEIPEDLE